MNIKIQSIHFDADTRLLEFVQEKVNKLGRYYDGIIGGEVFLKLDKSSTTENKVAEIKIQLRGNDLFVKKQCKTFEEAVDTSIVALTNQVKKYKEKVKGL
ncbi:MAG: ribosome-associated translation inhibitor RaiA [Bacteroidetes bacterium]|nr:ribosome-associated translation inhibitor RaiA [Bacteroidota bacterium]